MVIQVTVIALLAPLLHAVPAHHPGLATVRTSIPVIAIAVIAILALLLHAIAAHRLVITTVIHQTVAIIVNIVIAVLLPANVGVV